MLRQEVGSVLIAAPICCRPHTDIAFFIRAAYDYAETTAKIV